MTKLSGIHPYFLIKGTGDTHFTIESGIFFSVTRPSGVGGFVGFYAPEMNSNSAKFREAADAASAFLGCRLDETVWKIVGDEASLKKYSTLLAEWSARQTELRPKTFGAGVEIIFSPESGRIRMASVTTPRNGPRLVESSRKTKVLIVDDSQTIRNLLSRVLGQDSEIEIVGTADRPSVALKMIESFKPDVITLDIHMPEMDGVTFLKQYLALHPIPTIMISSISMEEGPMVLSALEAGAVDYVQKPNFDQLREMAPLIIEKIKSARAAHVKVSVEATNSARKRAGEEFVSSFKFNPARPPIIAIGSSTGGTEALRRVFERLPAHIPPILVVQHIPPVFSKAFADRMNAMFPFEVLEGTDGLEVKSNRIIIAPGGTQMSIRKSGQGYTVRVDASAPPTNRHKPSVDDLFHSVASHVGKNAYGIILTGMGGDGAKGLLNMRKAGARTIGQDESTSVVYGMPKVAFELGAVECQVSVDYVAKKLGEFLEGRRMAA